MHSLGNFIQNLRVSKKLALLLSIFVICLLCVSILSSYIINEVRINGNLYNQIISGKNLIADTLPPTEFIIDSYATVLDMANTTDQAKIGTLVGNLDTQKASYEERHIYWEENLQDENVRQLLIEDSYQSATQFFDVAENELVPLVLSGNQAAAQQLITEKLSPIYETHRAAIHQITGLVNEDNDDFESHASHTAITSIIILLILIVLGLITTIVLGIMISRNISVPVNRLKEYADRLAKGDTDFVIEESSNDEIGDLMRSFSKMIEETKLQSEAGARIARGDLSVVIKPRSEKDILAISMNSILDSMTALTTETRKLTNAAVEGDLSKRGNEEIFEGGFKEIVQGINQTIEGIVEPLNVALPFIEAIANGENIQEIDNVYEGQYQTLIENLMKVRNSFYLLRTESTELAMTFINGDFSYEPDLSQLGGGYRDIMNSVNKALNSIVVPLRIAGNYLKQIGNGAIPEKIHDEYPGDFQDIFNSINECIDGLSALVEGRDVLKKMSLNDYTTEVKGTYHGIYADIAEAINMVSFRVKNTARIINNIALGDLSDLEPLKEIGRRSENDILIPADIQMIENIKYVIEEANALRNAVLEGNLDYQSDDTQFSGAWKELVDGMNHILVEVSGPIKDVTSVMDDIASGNLHTSLQGNYLGEFEKLTTSVNTTANMLSVLVDELTEVIGSIAQGNLNLNHMRQYRGDFVSLSDSLNVIIDSLNDVMKDINEAAEQVASGSRQVSEGSQSLSQGSTEQASAIEELTASMSEIAHQTKQNAINANQANELASTAKENALEGNEHMQEMLHSMEDISDSSNNISNIIKVIDDIAFQTNILALNAAVEAARAGQHGKGFAVVAEEVRNLAARSAEAAKNTTELIEGSIQKVQVGTKIANETASALIEIVDGVEKAASLVGDIAVASNEQASGITQINKGIEQVSQVIQNNSATAEESAAASEELSSQAEMLKSMVGKFQLKEGQAMLGKPQSEQMQIGNASKAQSSLNIFLDDDFHSSKY